MNTLTTWATAHPSTAIAAVAVGLVVIAFALRPLRKSPAAVLVAALAAAACTAYSADTSWRFAADYLGMTSTGERAAMFAAAELALFACALMARQNLRTLDAPGTPGMLVWVITGVQVIPAYSESGPVGGTVRAVVGPILAALLWHLAMGIELRHARPDAESASLPALIGRELRERLLSRLGLAVRDRSAEQITRDRATLRAVALAAKLAGMQEKARGRGRVERRLSKAVGKAQVGGDEEQRAKLLDMLAARRNAVSLATMDLTSPWGSVAQEATGTEEPDFVDDIHEVPAPRPPVVPTGVRLLPLVARPAPARKFRLDHFAERYVPDDQPLTKYRWKKPAAHLDPIADDQPTAPEPTPEVVTPEDDSRSPDWTVGPYWEDDPVLDPQPAAVPAEQPRQVVTEIVTLTPSELYRRAFRLNREVAASTNRPVTIDRLREEFNISRREATDLRRLLVTQTGGERS
ncbi:hypothetical protein AB0E08_05005 [Streptomyces sp. NPDC048281]|uniref:hypothetical protein n=1 Tax=Streptomyces sp. NPDC048281 TaxID=3154715 RepID=UPI0034378BEC